MTSHRRFAATAAVALIIVGLAGCWGKLPGSSPPGQAPPAAGEPPGPVGPSPTASANASIVTLAVYFLGTERIFREADGQPIDRITLYRQFHRTRAGDGGPTARTVEAVGQMLDPSSALDPDYRSGWPSGAYVRDVSIAGDTVTVDIGGARTNSVGSEAAHQAVQQLIWTATAASGKPNVRLLLDGKTVDELWGHVALDDVLRRPAPEVVLADVWLIDPQHGATVGRTFTVHVSGYVHKATIYVLVRQGSRTVRETLVTVAGPTKFGEAKTSLTLAPGTYIIEAYAAWPASGGGKLFLDNHTITVG